MRYIVCECPGGKRTDEMTWLQRDGQLWYRDEDTGEFRSQHGYSMVGDFKNNVDGIYFADRELRFKKSVIRFMMPETYFLFNASMCAIKLYYTVPKDKREVIHNFANKYMRNFIQTKLGVKS